MRAFFCSTVFVLTLLIAPPAAAERVRVPLTLDEQFIESLLTLQVFTGPGDSLRRADDGSGCRYLTLREPRVAMQDGHIVLRTLAEARAGRAVGDGCLVLLDWRGQLEFEQEPVVGQDRESIVLITSSWRALRPDGSADTVSTTVGRWLEQFVPLALKETRIELAEPLDGLESLLAAAASPAAESPAAAPSPIGNLAIERVAVEEGSATVTLAADIETARRPSSARPEPALDAEELARLDARLSAVDAFFTYAIKSLAGGPAAPDANALLEVLVELRRDLVAILRDDGRRPTDPARTLFVDAWEGLMPVLRAAAAQQPDRAGAVRYLTFIAAGDALSALDALGPAAGIDVSSDGLRRLARLLVPDDTADPLEQSDAVDPALRRALGFGPPLPSPAPSPPRRDAATWLDWLVPAAVAAEGLDPAVVDKLNNWVPRTRDMDVYLPMVDTVLRHVVDEQLRARELDTRFHDVFGHLVLAAAWQESCWRQFTAEEDMRVPVRSSSGDIGMMQINSRVWRGLYDLHGLRWDIVYNARAGADILEHYLIDYALRHAEHETTGSIDSLARSAYAAYNGGPGAYDRYRRSDAPEHGRQVDALFYEKYLEVKRGTELPVTACYAG